MIWFEKSLKKTIGLYLIVNAAILFFSSDLYVSTAQGATTEVSFLGELINDNSESQTIAGFTSRILEKHKNRQTEVLVLQVISTSAGTQIFANNSQRLENLRESEYMVYRWTNDAGSVLVYMVEDRYQNAWQESLLQILSMVFACFVLTSAFFMGSQDSKIWFTGPYTVIMENINKLIRRPIDYLANPYFIHGELEKVDVFDDLELEYKTLGLFFFQYTPFLSYAFGSRQTNLVADRLLVKKARSLMEIKGDSYFAYICVLQLSDLMKVVDEATYQKLKHMTTFTQKVQEVIQRTADKFGGSSFCGVDGKYTLLWRLSSDKYKSNFVNSNRNSTESAAMCITCVLKLVSKLLELWKVFKIDELKSQPQDDTELEANPIKLTKISQLLRCVVNCGRVYEHIVGGRQKVDIICLGPDIAMTDRFHKLAMVYSMPILINQVVYQNLADSVKKQCRKVDIVKLKHFAHQLDIYSLDVALPQKYRSDEGDDINGRILFDMENMPTADFRLLHFGIKEKILERLIHGAKNSIFFEDPDIQDLFTNNWKFKRHCRKAIDFYGLGAWEMAHSELDEALTYEPDDGPCLFLRRYLDEMPAATKANWKGFRPTDI